MGPSRTLFVTVLPMLPVPIDPFVSCFSGDPEPLSQFGDGVGFQEMIFNKSLSLLAHGNTFPGYLPWCSSRVTILVLSQGLGAAPHTGSVTHVLIISVTYGLDCFTCS